MKGLPVADLHCDLLSYLTYKPGRDLYNLEARCSLPQLQAGGVVVQTLAIFVPTKLGSTALAAKQGLLFKQLSEKEFSLLTERKLPEGGGVYITPAIENASALCEEDEDLECAFERLDRCVSTVGPLLYVSLTHSGENRFGGGNATSEGLKDDGRALLECLASKNIPVDLSHTSDQLASDILNFIEQKKLPLIPVASHSNFRAVGSVKRNLLDEHALEIAKKGGVIGFTVFKPFLGSGILRQLEHAKKLGVLDHLCMGADFFYDPDVVPGMRHLHPLYYEEFGDSSCYPRLFKLFREVLCKSEIEGIAYKNFNRWLTS